ARSTPARGLVWHSAPSESRRSAARRGHPDPAARILCGRPAPGRAQERCQPTPVVGRSGRSPSRRRGLRAGKAWCLLWLGAGGEATVQNELYHGLLSWIGRIRLLQMPQDRVLTPPATPESSPPEAL